MMTINELIMMANDEEMNMIIINCEIVERAQFDNIIRDYGRYNIVTDWEFDEFDGVECIVAYTL